MDTVATYFYARLRNVSAISQSMSGDNLANFIGEVRRVLSEPVAKQGGIIAQLRADSILAVFANDPDAKPDHAQRALHAAVIAVFEAVQLSGRMATRADAAGLPALSLAVGVHLGTAEVGPGGRGSSGMVRAVGEAVEIARLLEVTASDVRWSIVASGGTLRAAAEPIESGRIGSAALPDGAFIDIVEITGLARREGSRTPTKVFQALREAVALNQQLAERPQDGGLAANQAATHFSIEGYRILRKIGEGGMASIFLAQPDGESEPQVLKVMRLDASDSSDGLQRFLQEFALLAQVKHPHVARIYRQNFSAGHAFIAMEYFSCGDLRARLAGGIPAETAIEYLRQIASGLAAIHAAGIVHRDLKPDNLMLRHDDTLALADFGVAKHVSMLITETAHGDIIGTPYYLSPEQALGKPVDARCDLYSLGIITYEMLMRAKPYHAATAQALLDLHINAPVPQLKAPYDILQPLLNRMMAKNRDQRYPSAQELLDELAGMGFY